MGEWTLPDPIDSTKVMGVEIDVQGAAQSINMATLAYKSWALTEKPDQILLKGQSIGNGQTIDFTDTCTLSTNAAGKLTLSTKGGGFVYIKNE